LWISDELGSEVIGNTSDLTALINKPY